jgi:hypothetical protein
MNGQRRVRDPASRRSASSDDLESKNVVESGQGREIIVFPNAGVGRARSPMTMGGSWTLFAMALVAI